MPAQLLAPRLLRLPRRNVLGCQYPVAVGFRARLLGLAHLDRSQAGRGLLIPRCRGVHTIGMRFALDLFFLDAGGDVIDSRSEVEPLRVVVCRRASAVLEVPSRAG
jgi:uncharacterized membrane protein (UPF0127 family)